MPLTPYPDDDVETLAKGRDLRCPSGLARTATCTGRVPAIGNLPCILAGHEGPRPTGRRCRERTRPTVRSRARRCRRRTSRSARPACSASPRAGSTSACPSGTADAAHPSTVPDAPPGQHDRQRAEVVLIAVAQRAAIEHQRVIEQRPVAVRQWPSAARGSTRTSSCGRCSAARSDPCCRDRSSGATGCGTGRGCSSPDRSAPLSSRANISVETRVMSAWNAMICRSISSFRCSWNVAGTPAGTSGSCQVVAHARLGALNPPLHFAHVVQVLRQAAAVVRTADRSAATPPGPSPNRAGCAIPAAARGARPSSCRRRTASRRRAAGCSASAADRSATSTRSSCDRRS